MIFVLPILGIIATVLTGSFLLRQGLALYREKKALAVLVLAVAFITYFVGQLGIAMTRIQTLRPVANNRSDAEQSVFLRETVMTVHSWLPLAFVIYFAILVRRDLRASEAPRNPWMEAWPAAVMVLLFVIAGML